MKTLIGTLSLLLLLGLTAAADAQLNINFSSAAVGPFALSGESSSVLKLNSSSNATLIASVSQSLLINTLSTFNQNGSNATQTFDASRILNINGVTGSLVQNLTIDITNTVDNISVDGGNTTTFDLGNGNFVDVTTETAQIQSYGYGTTSGDINATFLYRATAAVPEPSFYAMTTLFVCGGAGLLTRHKCKRANVTAA